MAGMVVAVAALADLLGARRLAWERASSAPLFADQEGGANGWAALKSLAVWSCATARLGHRGGAEEGGAHEWAGQS